MPMRSMSAPLMRPMPQMRPMRAMAPPPMRAPMRAMSPPPMPPPMRAMSPPPMRAPAPMPVRAMSPPLIRAMSPPPMPVLQGPPPPMVRVMPVVRHGSPEVHHHQHTVQLPTIHKTEYLRATSPGRIVREPVQQVNVEQYMPAPFASSLSNG